MPHLNGREALDNTRIGGAKSMDMVRNQESDREAGGTCQNG